MLGPCDNAAVWLAVRCEFAGASSGGLLMDMTIGLSLFAIAVGAILRFAVTAHASGIDIGTVGVILIVIGAIGLAVGLWLVAAGRSSVDQST